MSNKATIVAASLSDKDLKDSIDKLVKHVDNRANKMATSMDKAVDRMKKKLAELGDTNINIKVSDDKNTKNTKEETKAINESTEALNNKAAAYDKMAAAEKRAVRKKGIEYTTLQSDVDPSLTYAINNNKDVDAQLNSILQKEQEIIESKKKEVRLTQELAEAQSKVNYKGQSYSFNTSVQQMQKDSNALAKKNEELEKNAQHVDSVKRQYTELEAIVNRFVGTSESELLLFTKKSASINSLSESLKKMVAAYQEMSEQERNSVDGQKLINNIQKVQRAIEQARSKMNRPTNLDSILGFKPKTLDDIEYKLRMLSNYRSGIRFDTTKGKSELEQVSKAIDDLKKKETELLGKNKTLLESNNALARSWNYMKNRLAFYFTVGASTQFVKNIIEIRGQYEMLERSIGILFDSMQKGSQIFAELNAMAIKSPFTTMELGAAAKQLSAYNIKANEVVETTRRLADIAAAVGIPIERLTYALGQIKSYGYLNSRDARMFANAGIPLIQNLADMYTKLEGRLVSIGDVYDRIKKKQISFEDTVQVINEMTNDGGRFFNFQEKAADTLKVKLANLNLAYNNFLNQLGKSEQGMFMSALSTVESILKNWKSISRAINTAVIEFGIYKLLQIIILKYAKQYTWELTLQTALGKKLGTIITNLGRSMKALAKNPITWITVALIELTQYIVKWQELGEAAEAFNKKISDGSNENIESIDKFYKEYKKDLDSIASMNESDLTKMWERIRDEIEKVSKNAQQYISLLEKIDDKGKRIQKADEFLQQERVIQEEVKRLSERGFFDIGGGFMDDSLAEDLIDVEKYMNEMIKKYGDYKTYVASFRKEFQGFYDEARDANYLSNLSELRSEFESHFEQLNKLDIDKIMGVGSAEEKLARLRDAAQIVRDNFFATEEMADAGAESQQRYNRFMDDWIAKQAVANGLIEKEVSDIEARRSAWELFFNQITGKDKEMLDYLVKTGKTSSKEFKDIWDRAAEQVEKSSVAAYQAIKDQIADLRATPDIVINVVYRSTKKNLDAQQQEFEDKWITPSGSGVLSTDEYIKQEKENRQKYGRLNRKDDEDNVEWEKRLGEEYQDNAKAIKSLNAQLSKYDKLSEEQKKNASESMKQKAKERQQYKDLNAAILEVGKSEGFNYDQFKKGNKGSKADALATALSKETQIVNKLTAAYEKLANTGMSSTEALSVIKKQYGSTISQINSTLRKYGLEQLDVKMFDGKDAAKIFDYFTRLKSQIKSKGLENLKRIEPIEAIIDSVFVSARTIKTEKLIAELDNKLNKIKNEYDLSIEVEANPILGGSFANMFGIDVDSLPKSFSEALEKVQSEVDETLKGLDYSEPFRVLETDVNEYAKKIGVTIDSKVIADLTKIQKLWRDTFKKNMLDTEKSLNDYVSKYGNYSDKIAEIEANRLNQIRELNNAYFTEEMRNSTEYAAKMAAINNGAQTQKEQASFEEFKNSRYYTMMFENLDHVSAKTLRDMRKRILDAVEAMKHLTPEQVKTLMNQFEKVETALVKKSPFKTLTKDLKTYFKTMKDKKAANEAFRNAQEEYDKQMKVVAALKEKQKNVQKNGSESQVYQEWLDKEVIYQDEILKKLKEQVDAAQQKADKYNLCAKVAKEEAVEVAQVIANNLSSLDDLRDNIHETFGVEFSEEVNGAIDGFAKVGDGINQTVSSAKNGDIIGAASGAVSVIGGIADGIASIFGDGSARTARINKEIAASAERVRKLNMAYKNLDATINNAMGNEEIKARREAIANKQAQMEELQRQKELEASKRSKDRDDGKIKEYEESIQDLELEIAQLKEDVVSELLGEDVKSAAESFVDAWVDAWRAGGDTMDALSGKFDDMIDNLIKKSLASYLVSKRIQRIFDAVDKATDSNSDGGTDITMSELERIRTLIGNNSIAEQINKDLSSLYEALNIAYGVDADETLSALQQGIQSVTEDTASAIEAYMNGISQQVYLHSDLLTQIKDTIVGFDFDMQIATMSQILLQLQSSYNVQMSIKSMLEGWSNASGQAVRVELIS